MRTDPEGRFEAVIVAYALRDFELAASYFSTDCDYAIYIPTETGPFGGAVIGRAAILARFTRVDREFEVVAYETGPILATGERVRALLKYAYRHRASGEEIDGVGRIQATFADGKIVTWHAFHDADRIQAFVRMCRARLQAPPVAIDKSDRVVAGSLRTGARLTR